MAEISAADVAALRRATGAGMMDCKRALEESGGDPERARIWLREQGLAAAAKRAGRGAEEGAVDVAVEGGVGAIVELTCETDFVAKGSDVAEMLDVLTRQVLEAGPDDLATQPYAGNASKTVADAVKELGAKVNENVGLGRVGHLRAEDGILDGYKHVQSDRGVIGVLVELAGVDGDDSRARETAHDLALHIASAAPRWVRREDVPPDVIEQERQILEAQTRREGKPDQAVPKIVEGKLTGFFKQHVLVNQGFVREPKTPVENLVSSLGPDARVARFARIRVGED
jgi:elongation factor Ts